MPALAMMSRDCLIQPSRLLVYVVAEAGVAVVAADLAVAVVAFAVELDVVDFTVFVPTVSVRPGRIRAGFVPMTARFASYSFFQPPLVGFFCAIEERVSPAATL